MYDLYDTVFVVSVNFVNTQDGFHCLLSTPARVMYYEQFVCCCFHVVISFKSAFFQMVLCLSSAEAKPGGQKLKTVVGKRQTTDLSSREKE